ncbi:MAG: hypothetical protein IJK54_07005, partial [Clostridia bacterium]|nr:hypothetical protein [Clostridia bacterium]
IAASWGADPVTTFTGTLDGDGHTVTVSAPLFVQFAGTIKNLTINGAVVKEGTANEVASYAGAIANNVPKNSTNVVIDNITNNASITFKFRGGALIGQISSGSIVTITNCVNNGAILGGNMAGGFVGYAQSKGSLKVGDETVIMPSTLTVMNCVNNGNVTIDVSKELTGLASGIVGRYGGDDKSYDSISNVIIKNCLNTGAITGTIQAAGILAHARSSNVVIENCTNKGVILSTYTAANGGTSDAAGIFGSTANSGGHYCMVTISKCVNEADVTSKNARAAGIAGYVWCGAQGDKYLFSQVVDCVNKGNIQAGSFGSQFTAYTNDTKNMEGAKQNTTMTGVGLGTVSRCPEAQREEAKFYDCFVGVSSAGTGSNYNIDVKLADKDTPDWLTYAEDNADHPEYVNNRLAFSAKPDSLKVVSAAEAEAAAKALGQIGYVAPQSTNPSQPTGDTAVWVLVIAGVSLLGMGIALKARKA